MRRIVLLITICCQVFWVAAQKKVPKWMDKQRKAVVTVTTYGKDNIFCATPIPKMIFAETLIFEL